MTPLSAFNFNHSNNYGRQRLEITARDGLFDRPGFQLRNGRRTRSRDAACGAAGPARVARPQTAGGQGRDPRQRFRGPRCRPSGAGAHAEIQVRRRRFGEGGRNHHPGRPPRPCGRTAHPQRLPLQKSRFVTCAGSFSSWRCCARCAAPNAPRPSITPGVRTLRRSGRRSARLTCG